jgi:hypothetical protein
LNGGGGELANVSVIYPRDLGSNDAIDKKYFLDLTVVRHTAKSVTSVFSVENCWLTIELDLDGWK